MLMDVPIQVVIEPPEKIQDIKGVDVVVLK
jgi:hypothetical protein